MSGSSSRRFLADAAALLEQFRREAGVSGASPAIPVGPAEAGLRAALEAAEAKRRTLEDELAQARRDAAAADEENRLLSAAVERDAAHAADAAALRARAAETESRANALKERVVLLEADGVRLESLRRKAERAAAEAEAQSRAVEEALRRELRTAHDALDRAASEAGSFEARWKEEKRVLLARAAEFERRLIAGETSGLRSEIQKTQSAAETLGHELVTSRAEAEQAQRALLERLSDVEKSLAAAQGAGESALHDRLRESQAAAESLRRELAASRAEGERAQNDLLARLADLEKSVAQAPDWVDSAMREDLRRAQVEAEALRQQLAAERAAGEERELALRREAASVRAAAAAREQELRRDVEERERRARAEVLEAKAALEKALAKPTEEELLAASAADLPEMPPFVQPSVEPVLDPGWSRLMRLVRPPVEAAYAHLRRLSGTAMTNGQKALLRLAAASLAQASDSLSSVELSLEDSPAPSAPASILPVLEPCLTSWEPAFRQRGVTLAREWPASLPEAAFEPKALRVIVHHVLRNVLEAVPRGGRLSVKASRAPDGALRLEFVDDGPGFPSEWLARRFEPFAAPRRGRAGLGLSLVRRTLRRWGGEAEAANVAPGRGARLTCVFAPPPPARPAK